jgi:hypothetical protein
MCPNLAIQLELEFKLDYWCDYGREGISKKQKVCFYSKLRLQKVLQKCIWDDFLQTASFRKVSAPTLKTPNVGMLILIDKSARILGWLKIEYTSNKITQAKRIHRNTKQPSLNARCDKLNF